MLTKEEKEEVNKIQNKLLYQEKVKSVARQSQYTRGASIISSIIFVTNQRVIEKKNYPITPKFTFYEYNNIISATIKKGLLKSSIILVLPGEEVYLDGIDKDKAMYMADVINDHVKRYSPKSKYQRFGNSGAPIVNSYSEATKEIKSSHRIRKYFSEETKEKALQRQKNRSADCKKLLTIMDFDHISGDRSDNSPSNCQALCPTCHAYKTRTSY